MGREETRYDLAVIGAGPGGYVAAIKAAQLGKRVALIERGELGGVCLNVGCIPSKSLIAAAQAWQQVQDAASFGIKLGKLSFDYRTMKERKDRIVDQIRGSLSTLLKANKITIVQGEASFVSRHQLRIQQGGSFKLLAAEKFVIATGSQPIDVAAFPCDHRQICNSTSVLEITKLPRSMVVIGGGYIGCEFASLFSHLGVEVTILEALPTILAAQGKSLSDALTLSMQKNGVKIYTEKRVVGIDKKRGCLQLELQGSERLETELVVVAVGRSLVTAGLGLDRIGLGVNSQGAIEVNDQMETEVPGIYAIGDITGGAMLAHVASHQGMVAAKQICGEVSRFRPHAIPAVVFTYPELGSVGLTAEEAHEQGYQIQVGRFPFTALGKAIASGHTEGFVEIISERKTGEILGAQTVGHAASLLLAELALAINNELTLDCIIETIHAHPTESEAIHEAALLAGGEALHLIPSSSE